MPASDARKRSWLRRWAVGTGFVLAALIVVLGALPAILSTDPVRRRVVRMLDARIDGDVSIERWRLAWLRGQTLTGAAFKSATGDCEASVESLSVSAGLLSLVVGDKALGDVTIMRPVVRYVLPATPDPPV
ncbi:MAG: hypothetical protein O3A51_13115, partial [Verrucomicrobia bacterium]|nr:hypothetical protein [Verrucomicrobiota bacterium]